MAMSGMGGGRRRPMAEINMTPLVDVMLVLLVIFMITAPALDKQGVDVNLPKADGTKAGQGKQVLPFSLTIDTLGRVYVAGKRIETADVSTQLPLLLKGREKEILTINGDRALPYEVVMKVVSVVRRAGVEKINLAVAGLSQQ
ncbi:MAG TPA: biopolymer transporter ExbD [Planctomycetota bacterium]|nr:biopolymer transporter ExbD [Planctomycetota bacterium]